MGISPAPGSTTAAAGLAGVQRGIQGSDVFALQQLAVRQIEGIAPPPAPRTAPAPEPTAYFSPSTGKMFAGGIAFDQRDVQSAFRAAQQFTAAGGARPPTDVPDWQPLSRTSYDTYLTELRTPRGFFENVGIGARGAVGGLVGGVGRGLQMLGATETGPAIAGVGEAIAGQDEFDKQRSALIQQSNSLWSNILDASAQGLPSLGLGMLAAVGGALVGGPAGAAAGLSLATARTAGAVGGLISTSFPQQLNTFYEAAKNAKDEQGRPVYDPDNDPRVQATILGAAIGTTALDVFAPARIAGGLSRALTDAAQEAGVKALTGMARARAVGGAVVRGSIDEAVTEATQTLAERAVFDPEFRRQLSVQDWKAIGPYIASKYGEDILISAGAGAILGGGFGGAGRVIETRGPGSRERNVLDPEQTTAIQGKPPEGAPPVAPAPSAPQGDLFPGQDLGVAPPLTSAPTVGGGILYPLQPTGQREMFPTMAPSYAPPDLSGQGDLFTQGMGGGVPSPEPTQGSFDFTPPPTMDAVNQRLQLRPEFTLGARPQFGPTRAPPTPPAPEVAPSEPFLTPGSFIPTGAERLRRQPTQPTIAQTSGGNQLLSLRRQMELQQAQQQAAQQQAAQPAPLTAAERDYEAALAQAAEATPQALDPEAAVVGNNPAADNARRAVVNQFNSLTAPQQAEILAGYGNDPAVFLARVRALPTVESRKFRDQLARVAASVKGEPTSAPQVRQVEQGGVSQRPGDGGQVAGQGVNRDIPAQDQTAGGQAGGGNLPIQSGAPAPEVTPTPKPKPIIPKGRKPPSAPVVDSAKMLEDEGITLSAAEKAELQKFDANINALEALVACLSRP
jgi:hypothetical protein